MANVIPSRPRQTAARRKFAVVASQYNEQYVAGLLDHLERELALIAPGVSVAIHRVPGAFEIPLAVQEVASRGAADAVIALGVIIEGETAHANLIASTITQSLQQISLTHRIPVIHEVLLVKNEEQARARCMDEELNRGTEAARVAVRMAETMSSLRG